MSMSAPELPDYALVNRENWTRANAEYTDAAAAAAWAQQEIAWGLWQVPESRLGLLPDLAGKDVIELGCGTAYFGAWLKRAGARRVVGVDVTPAQLDTARRLEQEFGLGLELIEANAEAVPLPDAQFDFAISEYGASIWCDPRRWLPEAARLLRPGGDLVFWRNSPLVMLCMPAQGAAGDRLLRSQRGIYRMEWTEPEPTIEFYASHGELIRILRECGFEVIRLEEVYAPAEARTHQFYDHTPAEWAKRWPAEEAWCVKKRL